MNERAKKAQEVRVLIAQQFRLSEQTVKFHLTNIYRKLGVGSRTEAIRQAYEHGLIDNPLLP